MQGHSDLLVCVLGARGSWLPADWLLVWEDTGGVLWAEGVLLGDHDR